MRFAHVAYTMLLALTMVACAGSQTKSRVASSVVRPAFVSDSAYACIEEQLRFGPRVPGSEAHAACVDYLCDRLRATGAEVELQEGGMADYAGQMHTVRNIIAHIGADSIQSRPHILLCAHYDSRPWCDEDEEAYHHQGVPAANDGASGVAVLVECARQLAMLPLTHPVDIVLFDCEDMGAPTFYEGETYPDSWCLGSQLWATFYAYKVPYQYGILLDMVGGRGAQFGVEYYSQQYAENYRQVIWRTAQDLGYAQYFVSQSIGAITDDHYYVNTIASIPCVDIIQYDRAQGGFAQWWHTHYDTIETIDKATLQAVGETVLATIL